MSTIALLVRRLDLEALLAGLVVNSLPDDLDVAFAAVADEDQAEEHALLAALVLQVDWPILRASVEDAAVGLSAFETGWLTVWAACAARVLLRTVAVISNGTLADQALASAPAGAGLHGREHLRDLPLRPLAEQVAAVQPSGRLVVARTPLRIASGLYSRSEAGSVILLAPDAGERTWAHELAHALDAELLATCSARREGFADDLGALLLAEQPDELDAALRLAAQVESSLPASVLARSSSSDVETVLPLTLATITPSVVRIGLGPRMLSRSDLDALGARGTRVARRQDQLVGTSPGLGPG